LAAQYFYGIEDKKKRLNANGGYISDWKEFLDEIESLKKDEDEKVIKIIIILIIK